MHVIVISSIVMKFRSIVVRTTSAVIKISQKKIIIKDLSLMKIIFILTKKI